jgi:hypothetical protein
MSSTIHTLTPAGRIKKPSYSTVATWVKESWDEVDEDLIQRSFKCCGISTKTDSSEDNFIFDYDKLLDSADDNENEVVEVLDNLDDNEEYPEENDYKNDWHKENNDVNEIIDNDNDDIEDQDQELSSDDEESSKLRELRKKYKGY